MDLELKCDSLSASHPSWKMVVTIDGVDRDEVFGHFTIEDVIDHFGKDKFLDEIGEDEVIRYFKLELKADE